MNERVSLQPRRQFEHLVRNAVECRECFALAEVSEPFINVAQPRSVGPNYWKAPFRIAVLMLNPGQSRDDDGARGFLKGIGLFRKGSLNLEAIFAGQRESMPSWGNPRGRFGAFYVHGLGLNLDKVAFANVAWCATDGNKYPGTMLRRCFKQHTGPLLSLLEPHVVVASGSQTHDFADSIRELLPSTPVIRTLHYAHREGRAREQREFAKVRAALSEARAVAL